MRGAGGGRGGKLGIGELMGLGDLIAALTWPIDVVQELKEMEDEPGVVTDYASLLRAQREYKVGSRRPLVYGCR